MPTNLSDTTEHVFDQATRVTAGDSQWRGHASPDYWAFIGPFGGITAATMLRAIVEHSQREGDPLSLTVNYCAPIAEGPYDLDVRLIKANRSTQHWSVELTQNGGETAAFATAVFAVRRPSWSHRVASPPEAPPFDQVRRLPLSTFDLPWIRRYDFRFVEGPLELHAGTPGELASPFSKLWVGDAVPRPLDALSLASMSDAFFARLFHMRHELVPYGTVSLTTYFHVDAEDLIAENASHVLAVVDGNVFHKSYTDQTAALWSPSGKPLTTTQQIAYFKV